MSTTWLEVQRHLKARGYGLGSSGPNRDGVDGEPGELTAAAVLAELLKGGAAPTVHGLAEPGAFFANLRSSGLFVGGLEQPQVDGLNTITAACAGAAWPIAWTAYALATAYHETKKKLQPVREAFWLDEGWRRANLRYFPHYGRGYVQLTWPKNYQRADDELGLGGTLVEDLDRALEPEIAGKIMVRGMAEGWFTGRKLVDTLPVDRPGTFEQFKASRPIINGHDRDADVGNYALRFQAALSAGGWA